MAVLEQEKTTGIILGETDVEFEQTGVVNSAPLASVPVIATPSTQTELEAPSKAQAVDNQPGEIIAEGGKPKKQKKTRNKAKKDAGKGEKAAQPQPDMSYNQRRVARALEGQKEAGEEAANATIDFEAEQADFDALMGDSAGSVVRRHDLAQLIELMKKGVIVNLSIEAPSFLARLDNAYLGLEHEETAQEVAREYLDLGKLVLLPKRLYKRLRAIESKARKTLYRFAVSSHWGQFVPVHNYKRWKELNELCLAEFEEVKRDILDSYQDLHNEIVETYRPLAASTWRQYMMREGTKLREHYAPAPVPEEKAKQLLAERDGFIATYLERIRKALPTIEALESQFSYQVQLERIPLPTELARDKAQAEEIYQAQALQKEEHRSKLALIRQREEMERDLIESTRREADRLANEFFNTIVRSINTTMVEVAEAVLSSIANNEGKLISRSALQLRGLLGELEGYREFLGDERLGEQIERIQSALKLVDVTSAGRSGAGGLAPVEKLRLDTKPLKRVLNQIKHEAQTVLLDLDTAPVSRTDLLRRAQAQGTGSDTLLDLDGQVANAAGDTGEAGQHQGQSSRNQFNRRQRGQVVGDSPLLDI